MTRMLGFVGILAAALLLNLSDRPVSRSDDARERFLAMVSSCAEAADKAKPGPCQLYGKIKYVEHFPDVTVKIVENFPDLKVKIVENFPGCGK